MVKNFQNYNDPFRRKTISMVDNGVYNLRRTLLLIKIKNESVEKTTAIFQ
jgi:hypothetical protein